MSKLAKSFLYSGLFTLYGACFYFFFGLLFTMGSGGDVGKFLGDFIVGCLLMFGLGTFVMYEIQGAFDELNKPRSRDKDKNDPEGGCPTDPRDQS